MYKVRYFCGFNRVLTAHGQSAVWGLLELAM